MKIAPSIKDYFNGRKATLAAGALVAAAGLSVAAGLDAHPPACNTHPLAKNECSVSEAKDFKARGDLGDVATLITGVGGLLLAYGGFKPKR